ncbi:MAG: Trans-aconitate 2-methyltransferase [Steroidobacteraceae bacterium]|nr:Trans-aconitate 2-methyltransferase [Steroidobacteraceae bacterium]
MADAAPADAIARQAGLDFVLALRRRWADTVYPQLRREHDAAREARIAGLPTYPWFAWLERGAQRMLWRAVIAQIEAGDTRIPAPAGAATATLDQSLELPGWYTGCDIHVQPGGVWRDDEAALVYELGAKLVMLGTNDDYGFHRLFVDTAIPRRAYRRIVDLGCGFGKSTWPFKAAFPDAEVIGIDLSGPCVRLAAHRAGERGLGARFVQANAVASGLEPGSVDLVTSTMLVHEMPVAELERLFVEAARLLAPGGILRFLDFQRTGDAFRDFAMLEHGSRNNEPFMPPMMAADLPAMAARAGLVDAHWVAFDERGQGRLDRLAWPLRPEWHFPWAVLEAEKPV